MISRKNKRRKRSTRKKEGREGIRKVKRGAKSIEEKDYEDQLCSFKEREI